MATVKDLLKDKFTQVWYVTPTSTVSDALKLLAEQQIGAVLVVEAGKIVGIFSERDFARKALSPEVNLSTPVGDLMVRGVYYVTPDQSVESCMAMMTAKRFRHMPVLEDGKLVGVISIGDVIRQIMSEKDSTIQSLEDYIWVHMI
jgi:CBS domain-containing protein